LCIWCTTRFLIVTISLNIQEIKIGESYISHLLYADDLALISDTVFGLQRQLNILADYCREWGLTVNIDKTKIIVFRRGGQLKGRFPPKTLF
jgi:hypothetical protein